MRILKSVLTHLGGAKPLSDEALITAISKGDVGAFEDMHRNYFPKLMHFSRRITGSAEAAEEVANDVLMTVWRTADRFERRSKALTWIFGIAYRIALKQRQKLMARRSDVELNEDMVAGGVDTADAVMMAKDLGAALGQLTPELRAVVELTYYNGYLYTEIAEILECPVGTVKTGMMTARKRLRILLSDHADLGGNNEVA